MELYHIMKKISKISAFLLFSALLLIISGKIRTHADTIGLSDTTKTVYAGKTFTLVLNGANGNIRWKSSNPEIAKVVNGRVTTLDSGNVTITATYNKIRYKCNVTIKNPGLNYTEKRMRVGNSFSLRVKGTKAVSYISFNPDIASVDQNGTVTALSKGNTTVFVACENSYTYACNIRVYEQIQFIENPTFEDLAPTTKMTFAELLGDNGVYGYPEYMPSPDTYKIIVDLRWQVVMAYRQDENGEYTIPVRYMLCSSGADKSQSPTGTFKMKSYRVRFSIFNNTDSYAQYWSLITGRIYFHSVLYSSLNASDYTSSYKSLGSNVSHGCIRLTVPDARWIWYNVAPGSTVVIRSGSSADAETKAIRDQLKLAPYPSERLKLKKGESPWTDNWTIEDVPQDVEFIQGEQ